MPKTHRPYTPAFGQQMIDVARSGRTPEQLAQKYEPAAGWSLRPGSQAFRERGLVYRRRLLLLAIAVWYVAVAVRIDAQTLCPRTWCRQAKEQVAVAEHYAQESIGQAVIAEAASRQAVAAAVEVDLLLSAAEEAVRTLRVDLTTFRDGVNRLAALTTMVDTDLRDSAEAEFNRLINDDEGVAPEQRHEGTAAVSSALEAAEEAAFAVKIVVEGITKAQTKLWGVISARSEAAASFEEARAAADRAQAHAAAARGADRMVQQHLRNAKFPFLRIAKQLKERSRNSLDAASAASAKAEVATAQAASYAKQASDAVEQADTAAHEFVILARQVCGDDVSERLMADAAIHQCQEIAFAAVAVAFFDARPVSHHCYVGEHYLSLQAEYRGFHEDLFNVKVDTSGPLEQETLEDLQKRLENIHQRINHMHRKLNAQLISTRADFYTVLPEEVKIVLNLFGNFTDVLSHFATLARSHAQHLMDETIRRKDGMQKLSGHLRDDMEQQIEDIEDVVEYIWEITANIDAHQNNASEAYVALERYHEDVFDFGRCVMKDGGRRRPSLPMWFDSRNAELRERHRKLETGKEEDIQTTTCEALAVRVQAWEELLADVATFITEIDGSIEEVEQKIKEHRGAPPNDHNPKFSDRLKEMIEAYIEESKRALERRRNWRRILTRIESYKVELDVYWRTKYGHEGRCPQ